jgi:hypothetical protein
MTGYNLILKIRRLEEECDKLGFMLCHSKHGNYRNEFGDIVALRPKDIDSLPIYARDAELFCGTLDNLEVWLRGVEWARNYDYMLRISDDKKREAKEQKYRNEILVKILKGEKVSEVTT